MDGPLSEKFHPFSLQHYLPFNKYKYELEEDEGGFIVNLWDEHTSEKAYIYGRLSEEGQLTGNYRIFTGDKCYNFNFVDGLLLGEADEVSLMVGSEAGSFCNYLFNGRHFFRSERFFEGSLLVEIRHTYFSNPIVVDSYRLTEPMSQDDLEGGLVPSSKLDKLTNYRYVAGRLTGKFQFYASNNELKDKSELIELEERFYLRSPMRNIRTVDYYSHPLLDLILPLPTPDRRRDELLRLNYSKTESLVSAKIVNREKKVTRVLVDNQEIVDAYLEKLMNVSRTDFSNMEFKFGSFA